MIIVLETLWTGLSHTPGNAGLLRTVCRAFPGRAVHFFAEADHVAEVRRLLRDDDLPDLETHRITVPAERAAPWSRFRAERRLIADALAHVDDGGPGLVVLAAADGPNIAAATLATWQRGGDRWHLHHRLHGNLAGLNGWRSRHPVRRTLDLQAGLTRWDNPRARYIVLEPHIAAALGDTLPALRDRLDILPEPIDPGDVANAAAAPAAPPIRIGYLGLATRAKGFDAYLDLARAAGAPDNPALSFHAFGKLHDELATIDQSVLATPMGAAPMARPDFLAGLASLHYVCLPYQGDYYRWAASGVLVDAIGFAKPIIATDRNFVTALFEAAGPVGHHCPDLETMAAVLRALPHTFPDRYADQVAAMTAARAARGLDAAADRYRGAVTAGFPRFAAGEAGRAALGRAA